MNSAGPGCIDYWLGIIPCPRMDPHVQIIPILIAAWRCREDPARVGRNAVDFRPDVIGFPSCFESMDGIRPGYFIGTFWLTQRSRPPIFTHISPIVVAGACGGEGVSSISNAREHGFVILILFRASYGVKRARPGHFITIQRVFQRTCMSGNANKLPPGVTGVGFG